MDCLSRHVVSSSSSNSLLLPNSHIINPTNTVKEVVVNSPCKRLQKQINLPWAPFAIQERAARPIDLMHLCIYIYIYETRKLNST